MAITKISQTMLLMASLLFINITTYAENSLENTQTLQIYTHFRSIVGKPTWLLIIRDVNTGLVSPYVFDIQNNDNFWVAFTYGHNYKITASTLSFGRNAVINNFCHLENGILSGKSMYMTLTGVLTPNPRTLHCNVLKYNDSNFVIANPDFLNQP